MPLKQPITVYNFRVMGNDIESSTVATFKATREAIERKFSGEVLEGTAQDVDPDELDAHGRYRRVATGWGELDLR